MNTETSNKNVTVAHLKKALERAKEEHDKSLKALSTGSSGETATDAEIDAKLNDVFGTKNDPGGENEGSGE